MARHGIPQDIDSFSISVEQVLNAERNGLMTLEQSRQLAESIVAAAHTQVAAILRRRDERIATLRARCADKNRLEFDAALAAIPGNDRDDCQSLAEELAAVHRVAILLVGG